MTGKIRIGNVLTKVNNSRIQDKVLSQVCISVVTEAAGQEIRLKLKKEHESIGSLAENHARYVYDQVETW
jgi:hypothetical protein